MSLVTERTGLSPNFLNPKLVYTATGDQILALGTSNTPKMCLASANSTNGQIQQDKVYFRKLDNTLQVLNLTKHYHDTDTDQDGGLLQESLFRNVMQTINMQLFGSSLLPGMQNLVGTNAAITADYDNATYAGGKINLSTGPYANNVCNIRHGGVSHDWSKKSKMNIVTQIPTGANLVVRAGINAEPLTLTNDVNKKAGIEFCDSTGLNWQIFSSNGTRSILNTTYPGSTSKAGYQILHTPATNTRLQVGASSYTTKTTDCPGTGASDSARLVGCGIKTTDATTKTMLVYGITFVGSPLDVYY